jgi:squalene-hopene/tetraprenyl-beta-curcumene cyclase
MMTIPLWLVLSCFAAEEGIDWNPRLAAEYLDARQKEWFAWKPALNAPGGPCVSCHTGVTYLLARPALRRALGEAAPTSYETGLLAGLRARVGHEYPFSGLKQEPKASQARGVEAIHAAWLLAEESRGSALSPDARKALDRLWTLQVREGESEGAWAWFSLDLDPWETPDSVFYGATLAALAAGAAPADYLRTAEVRPRVAALLAYLRRRQASQPLHNRLMLLWAATRWPDLLPDGARQKLVAEAWSQQQPDGGWTMESLGPWKARPGAPAVTGSNGYATALATLILQRTAPGRADTRLARALAWLRSRQERSAGSWPAESMNKRYEPDSMMVRFMRDAATGYAALALVEADERKKQGGP